VVHNNGQVTCAWIIWAGCILWRREGYVLDIQMTFILSWQKHIVWKVTISQQYLFSSRKIHVSLHKKLYPTNTHHDSSCWQWHPPPPKSLLTPSTMPKHNSDRRWRKTAHCITPNQQNMCSTTHYADNGVAKPNGQNPMTMNSHSSETHQKLLPPCTNNQCDTPPCHYPSIMH